MLERLLAVREVVVSFDGFRALDGVSFTLMPGEVRILIGPNGAGKSTLLDAIIGKVWPASGHILFKGRDISALPEHLIARLGIGRKFQAPGILENLTVFENLVVATRSKQGFLRSLGRGLSPEEVDWIAEILEEVGLEDKKHFLAGQLAHGEKQWLEIGMVLAMRPDLILLDEPTAGMTVVETRRTAELVKKLAGRHAVLVVDHDMAFVEMLEAPVTVLHMGRVLREGRVEDVRQDPEVIAVYLGRAQEGGARA